jgi:hypothetical protein
VAGEPPDVIALATRSGARRWIEHCEGDRRSGDKIDAQDTLPAVRASLADSDNKMNSHPWEGAMSTNEQRCMQRHDRLRAIAVAFTSAASLALTACGGGGGSGSPSPAPAPAAALSVAAAASTALPSGNAVSVAATLTNGTGTPAWSLTGPGSLSTTTGGT